MSKRPRIVVAGQLPPPMGGQNAMVLELLENLRSTGRARVEHLAFRFTPDTQSARKGQMAKIVELVRVIGRLLKLRLGGSIDLLVFPSGGPQTVPMFRDLLLLPWVLLLSRRVVLQFHAAGLADAVAAGDLLARSVAWLGGCCPDAVVMTAFNRRDPVACGIETIHVVPHALEDQFREGEVARGDSEIRLLAMGHLCADKGTPNLIKAVAALRKNFPELVLELAGEPLAPYSHEILAGDIERAGMRDHVRLLGLVSGEAKRRTFGRASLFAFPSVAPYESFGLVMVEAMMWGLPIVASDWRGNADVLGDSAGSVTFAPPDSSQALEDCLRLMLGQREQWPELGQANREHFLTNYDRKSTRQSLSDLLLKIAADREWPDAALAILARSAPISTSMDQEHPSTKGVAAVFVTMNRREIASTCLAKLAGQTRRPERVFVVDNASTDGTGEMLAELSERHAGWIEVIASTQNLGNAGGMQLAMERVFAEGFAAVWILDDDSWPEPEALARLMAADLPADAVRSCRVVDFATGGLSWPVQLADGNGWDLLEAQDRLPPGEVLRIRRSWLGALIPREVYQTVGPVEGRLFLRGEDEDYPRRIERAGFPVFMVTDSLLHHPAAGTLKRWDFAGRTMVLESGLAGDKLYYRLRNTWWITRRDHGAFEAAVTSLLNALALLRWEDSMQSWLPVWWEAARDAFTDRLGKRRR